MNNNTFVQETRTTKTPKLLLPLVLSLILLVPMANASIPTSATGSFTATFTGTVNGISGTVVISGSSTGTGATGSGQFVVELGTAGLSGLHAQGTFQPTVTGPTTVTGTYSLQYDFDP